MKLKSYIGMKFNKLEIIKELAKKKNYRYFECRCECGNITTSTLNHIKSGHTKSCGCNIDLVKIIHNKSYNYLYKLWQNIKERCHNPNAQNYRYYGAKGIIVFNDWKNNYELFEDYILKELGERPEGLSLDRIKNNLGYIPGNLRWATAKEQANNRG